VVDLTHQEVIWFLALLALGNVVSEQGYQIAAE
jgi:hypothetical protein